MRSPSISTVTLAVAVLVALGAPAGAAVHSAVQPAQLQQVRVTANKAGARSSVALGRVNALEAKIEALEAEVEALRSAPNVGPRGPEGPRGAVGGPGPQGPAGPASSLLLVRVSFPDTLPAAPVDEQVGWTANCPAGYQAIAPSWKVPRGVEIAMAQSVSHEHNDSGYNFSLRNNTGEEQPIEVGAVCAPWTWTFPG